jgi:hypothetical protein
MGKALRQARVNGIIQSFLERRYPELSGWKGSALSRVKGKNASVRE